MNHHMTTTVADRIIIAAADLFMRYGFARTTMRDIAMAAGISRPTLYAHMASKEDAFEAAVLHLNALRLSEIAEHLTGASTLREKLVTVLRLWLVQVYELQRTVPDARDMDDLSLAVVRKVYSDLQALVAGLIAVEGNTALSASAADLARLLVFSVRGLGAAATSSEDFLSLIGLEVDLLCNALQGELVR